MAINFNKAEFVLSAVRAETFIRDGRPQVTFAGRSNVGKSSVINRLLGRKNFARVGATPGKTSQINYFDIDGRLYFTDLPGYGYAKVAKEERDRWGRLMERYFAEEGLITLGVLIVDARHKPTADDVTMCDWFKGTGCPVIVVANKLDKLKKSEVEGNLQRVRDWFLFATFTGLSYADLKRLSEKDITQSDDGTYWIHIRRQKTETPSAIRLLNVPLQIIEKYRHERKSDRIFNLYCRGYLIKLTRELGRTYGFDMTFHKARHNFGTHITLSLGVPIETVSRMMGHKSISTTQIYAKVTDRKVDEDMKRLKEQTKGRKINLYEEDEPETADIITVNG